MEIDVVFKKTFHCRLIATELYLYWEKSSKTFIFPFEDIIGSKQKLDKLHLMVFNRVKDKLKIYKIHPIFPEDLISLSLFINSHIFINEKSFALFLNPISGKKQGPSIFNKILSKILDFSRIPFKVFEITSASFFSDFNTEQLSSFSHILVLGGDGTMQELLTELYKKDNLQNFIFGIIPVGSQNALSCELTGKSMNSALLSVVHGKVKKFDLMKVVLDGRLFVCTTAVSWGLVSDISERAQKYRILGPFRYVLTSVLRLCAPWRSFDCEFFTGNQRNAGQFLTVTIGNHRAQNFYGNEIVFPHGKFDDGFIDIQIVKFVGKIETARLMAAMSRFGSHVSRECVSYQKGKKFEMKTRNHEVFNLDGEIRYGKEVTVEILPSYIKFLTI
jgi:YegS/Rv2252/BmrU family lipid kinase